MNDEFQPLLSPDKFLMVNKNFILLEIDGLLTWTIFLVNFLYWDVNPTSQAWSPSFGWKWVPYPSQLWTHFWEQKWTCWWVKHDQNQVIYIRLCFIHQQLQHFSQHKASFFLVYSFAIIIYTLSSFPCFFYSESESTLPIAFNPLGLCIKFQISFLYSHVQKNQNTN